MYVCVPRKINVDITGIVTYYQLLFLKIDIQRV